ncbi:mechanosensitive ion channel [Paraglaciecola aquimarina]|uniref:Mechanosensitive ion channel n=1 Tax=Paraglaciecola aquimarina TaxID=1235557 RepID=A0ABU3ST91_9ALTE|nr:mechanosensitive ion channel domain-containing protein [Paraglaciecola aquimarina]MDU0353187.1 mechanosensitive ion channel [Paraglaciecola aquimarina]
MQIDNVIHEQLVLGLTSLGIELKPESWTFQLISLGIIFICAWLSLRISGLFLTGRMTSLVMKSKNNFDDQLHKFSFFRRSRHIFPALIIYVLSGVLIENISLLVFLQKSALIYILIVAVKASSALLNAIEGTYNASNLAKKAPITGFVQVGKLFVVIVAGLLIISNLLDKSPLLLLSGLGAVTAILLLLFRDTILGFVAGIQIAANRMVNTGDWIEMAKYGADGDVLEVGLTTVKVQNWDKTISTIPTYALITESVKNWRGMSESGGRRIKRSIYLDIQSIQFCDEAMLNEFSNIRYIQSYIDSKKQQLQAFHQEQKIDNQDLVNSRRLTNIGTLRAYMQAYLVAHPKINQDMTLMVRQLPPTELGVPLEVYCFCSDKAWVNYEAIQGDIFDHFLAMLPIFNLRAYQRVSDRPH